LSGPRARRNRVVFVGVEERLRERHRLGLNPQRIEIGEAAR